MWFLSLLMLSPTALAAERNCEGSYTADDFRSWVADADTALSNDDIVGHGAAYRTIKDNLPCLEVVVPSDSWADFLVGLAVIENALGQDWQEPMTSAMLADPDVTRDFGSTEVQAFAPVLVSNTTEALPADAEYWIDGKKVTRVRPLPGVHIVQRRFVGVWEARLVRAGEFPIEWREDKPLEVAEPVVEPRKTREPAEPGGTWGTVGVLGAFGTDDQAADLTTAAFPDGSFAGAAIGLGSSGEVVFGMPGVFWDASIPVRFGSGGGLAPDLFAGGRVGVGPASIWVGGGAVSVQVQEGDDFRNVLLPQPHIGMRLGLPISSSMALDAGLAGGWTPSATHESLAIGVRSIGGFGFSTSLDVGATQAAFVDEGGGSQLVKVTRLRAGLRVGIAFGG